MENDISYQKQIHDYLEGNLSPDEERQLFDNLSANSQWREELAFQMRMQQTIQKDIGSVSIPAKATAGLFASLGFEVPQKIQTSRNRRRLRIPIAIALQGLLSTIGRQSIVFAMGALSVLGVGGYLVVENYVSDTPSGMQKARTRSENIPSVPAPSIQTPSSSVDNANNKMPDMHDNGISGRESAKPVSAISEGIKVSRDIGKFSSVDYLTKTKIVGIANAGKIYFSDDGGLLWATQSGHTRRDLFGVHFIDTSHGVIVGAAGAILLTSNSGIQWKTIPTVTEANLICVRYATRDTLYACGGQGMILRSINGGSRWQKLESGTSASLFKIHFESGSKGSISGEGGITVETDDAGKNWKIKN